jgi:mono/diheme cytochrome c family protein
MLLILVVLLLSSCRQEMADTGRFQPMDYNDFFKDGRMARAQPLGTVAQNQLRDNEQLYTGMQHSKLSPTFPFEISEQTLQRGRDRFNIFCAPCHDGAGTGHGVAVQRGFEHGPETFHQQRLRDAAPGYFFQAISNGFGLMNGYAAQIAPEDRWAVVAYIRALQLSENAVAGDLPELDRQKLESQK